MEYKKKIALVEGKRRAMYNKFEREKTENRERERLIDDELKVEKNIYIFLEPVLQPCTCLHKPAKKISFSLCGRMLSLSCNRVSQPRRSC